jgi:hypothetical protein
MKRQRNPVQFALVPSEASRPWKAARRPFTKALANIFLQRCLCNLESDSPRLRRNGAEGLESLGVVPIDAVPVLERLAYNDSDPNVRAAARKALNVLSA